MIKARTGVSTPEAVGNATADRLAARACSGSSGSPSRPLALSPDPGCARSQ